MPRIGKLAAGDFGALSVEPSPAGYRLRSRFHGERRGGGEVVVGGFAPRTHRVESLAECLALGAQARGFLPRLERALAESGEDAPEIATVESLDGKRRLSRQPFPRKHPPRPRPDVGRLRRGRSGCPPRSPPLRRVASSATGPGRRLLLGAQRLWISPAGRELPATADAFFQANRFLVGPLAGYVREAAAAVPASDALDLFGGVGLFAGSLLDAGHSVVSVESDREGRPPGPGSRATAGTRGSDGGIERGDALGFAAADPGRESVVVADPPLRLPPGPRDPPPKRSSASEAEPPAASRTYAARGPTSRWPGRTHVRRRGQFPAGGRDPELLAPGNYAPRRVPDYAPVAEGRSLWTASSPAPAPPATGRPGVASEALP